jgi:hypothetical protein
VFKARNELFAARQPCEEVPVRKVPRFLLLLILTVATSHADDDYPHAEDSKPQLGVNKGEVKGPFKWTSEIFPGTVRDYWNYVPAQYDASKPACLLVAQDGLGRARDFLVEALDNLIHKKEIPVMLGSSSVPASYRRRTPTPRPAITEALSTTRSVTATRGP